jgi:hypothetical protein
MYKSPPCDRVTGGRYFCQEIRQKLRSSLSPVVVTLACSWTHQSHSVTSSWDTSILSNFRTIGISHDFCWSYGTGIRDTHNRHLRRLVDSQVGDIEYFIPIDVSRIEDSGRREIHRIFWSIRLCPGGRPCDINPTRASTGTRLIETGLESCSWRTRSDSEASSSIKGTDTAILTDREIAQGIRWCNRRITAGTSDDSGSSHTTGIGWTLTGCSERDICWSYCIAATAAADSPGICRTAVVCWRDAGIPVPPRISWCHTGTSAGTVDSSPALRSAGIRC